MDDSAPWHEVTSSKRFRHDGISLCVGCTSRRRSVSCATAFLNSGLSSSVMTVRL